MKKGISKVKICVSLDIEIYQELEKLCSESDAKMSTKINSILKKSIEKKR